jgi:lysophospholipase L1-like esterase
VIGFEDEDEYEAPCESCTSRASLYAHEYRAFKIQVDYASADDVHPNDAGYRAMADAIDLKLFTRP